MDLLLQFSEPECLDSLESFELPPLPGFGGGGEEEEREGENNTSTSTIRLRFWRQHDSLRVAKHRIQSHSEKLKTRCRQRLRPVAQAVAKPMKQESVSAAGPKPRRQTDGSPTAPRGRSATRRVARRPPENPSR